MDTKLLRQKILDLAIRGKLVPQDPNDEPASVLLERIKAEKERLIKEGKIKRSKQSTSTSDSRHYVNAPFEIPGNWAWCKLEDIVNYEQPTQYIVDSVEYNDSYNTPVLTAGKSFILGRTNETKGIFSDLPCIIFDDFTTESKLVTFPFKVKSSAMKILKVEAEISIKYVALFMSITRLISKSHKRYWISEYSKIPIPIPPTAEQKRIIAEIEKRFALIDQIEQAENSICTTITQAKSKILNLAIQGKLVPQDPADEPASELLKRVNPSAEITCDNEHYPQLPNNWAICKLEDIIKYEQPTPYIVASTEYNDSYKTPVLTAGKSFIIGKTNESSGVFNNLPCIIFDDFTTDSRLVDFPFKVKSSAMKILKVSEEISIEYVTMFMSITRLIGKSHKRYWISEYSKIHIPIPPKEEQRRIVAYIKRLNGELNNLSCNL